MSRPRAVRLLLVRHGQQGRASGDDALTALGRDQARATAAAIGLTADDRLVSSTMRRAVETAAAMGRPPEQYADLDEFRFGPAWTWADGDAREDLVLWRPEHRAPGGESMRGFQTRIQEALQWLLADPPPGRLVLVVHSGVIDAVVRWAFGLGPESPWTTEVVAPHASITEIEYWPQGRHASGAPRHAVLARSGDVRHLTTAQVTGA